MAVRMVAIMVRVTQPDQPDHVSHHAVNKPDRAQVHVPVSVALLVAQDVRAHVLIRVVIHVWVIVQQHVIRDVLESVDLLTMVQQVQVPEAVRLVQGVQTAEQCVRQIVPPLEPNLRYRQEIVLELARVHVRIYVLVRVGTHVETVVVDAETSVDQHVPVAVDPCAQTRVV